MDLKKDTVESEILKDESELEVIKTAKDKLNKWKKYKGEKTTETYRQYK